MTAPTAPGRPDLVGIALTAARAGADVLLARYGKLTQIDTKSSPGDLVTDADRAAEQAVRKVLSRLRPHDAMIGEEFGSTGSSPAPPEASAGDPALRWVIDPLDGTTNYVRGIVYWSTSVAVTDATGVPLAGAVVAPALGRTYYAGRGAGAWRLDDGQPPRRLGPGGSGNRGAPERTGSVLGMGLSYDPSLRGPQWRAVERLLPLFTDIRRLGSAALDLCALADGAVDAFVESDLHEYDWAAGALIAREAGASVTGPRGGPPSRLLLVAARPDLANHITELLAVPEGVPVV